MRCALAILVLLLLGHAALGGLFWGLLNVPESSVWMLALSSVLVVLIVLAAGWLESTAALGWIGALNATAARRGVRAIPVFLVATALFLAFWWTTERAGEWFAMHTGEIDAWLMMRFRSPRTAWVHQAIALALFFTRYVVGVSVAAAVLTFGANDGLLALTRPRWLRAAFARQQIGSIGIAVVLLIAMPLKAVYWRPTNLPPTTLEMIFVGAKLLLLYLVVNVGWCLVLWGAARSVLATPTVVRGPDL